MLSGGTGGPHGIQGIGAGFVPDILDTTIIDDVITISTEEALAAARQLTAEESLLVGISSGVAVADTIRQWSYSNEHFSFIKSICGGNRMHLGQSVVIIV